MRRIVLCVLLVLTSIPIDGAPAPLAKRERLDRRPDLERLQGEWQLVQRVDCTGRAAACEPGEITLLVTGERFLLEIADGKPDSGILTIDPASTPKKMNLSYPPEQLDNNPALIEATTALCIYRLRGDTLRVRIGGGRKGRPADFTSPPATKSSDTDVWTFQRSKGQP